ncbi:MAG: hypothetical protein ACRDHZ_06430 [Ktedonobacteraceae bacterium]
MKGLKIFLVILFIVGILFIFGTGLGASHGDDQSAQTPSWLTNLGAKLVISQPLKLADLSPTPTSCLQQGVLTVPTGITCTFAVQQSTFAQRVATVQLLQGASAVITLTQAQIIPAHATLTGAGATTTTTDLKIYPGKAHGLLTIRCSAASNAATCLLKLK